MAVRAVNVSSMTRTLPSVGAMKKRVFQMLKIMMV